MSPIFFKRGIVFQVEFPPDDPERSDNTIPKYALNLQEGRVVDQAETFVCLLITTEPEKLARRYPWDVYLTPAESKTANGAKVYCNQVYTLPKDSIIDYAYCLSEPTMREVDEKLVLGLCMDGVRFEEPEEEQEGVEEDS